MPDSFVSNEIVKNVFTDKHFFRILFFFRSPPSFQSITCWVSNVIFDEDYFSVWWNRALLGFVRLLYFYTVYIIILVIFFNEHLCPSFDGVIRIVWTFFYGETVRCVWVWRWEREMAKTRVVRTDTRTFEAATATTAGAGILNKRKGHQVWTRVKRVSWSEFYLKK